MKKSIIYLTISATLTFSGCDYLDSEPEKKGTLEEAFASVMIFLRMNRTI